MDGRPFSYAVSCTRIGQERGPFMMINSPNMESTILRQLVSPNPGPMYNVRRCVYPVRGLDLHLWTFEWCLGTDEAVCTPQSIPECRPTRERSSAPITGSLRESVVLSTFVFFCRCRILLQPHHISFTPSVSQCTLGTTHSGWWLSVWSTIWTAYARRRLGEGGARHGPETKARRGYGYRCCPIHSTSYAHTGILCNNVLLRVVLKAAFNRWLYVLSAFFPEKGTGLGAVRYLLRVFLGRLTLSQSV